MKSNIFLKNILMAILTLLFIYNNTFSQVSIPGNNGDDQNPNNIILDGSTGHNNSESGISQQSLKNFVNMQTGALVYQVPFFQLQSYQLSLPISLQYSSNGIRVDQESFPYGLGWSLNAGGAITRKLKGLPDEHERGFLSNGGDVLDYLNLSDGEKKTYIDKITGKRVHDNGDNCFGKNSGYEMQEVDKIDSEPDIFQFSFPGSTGYFTFDNDGNIIQYPHQNMDITFEFDLSGKIKAFQIVASNGVKYTFGNSAVEEVKQSTLSVPIKNNLEFDGIPVYQKTDTDEPCSGWGQAGYRKSLEGDCYQNIDYFDPKMSDEYPQFCDDVSHRKWYSSSEDPEIDLEHIKEYEEEWYNSKWYLTKIEHPSGDQIDFTYNSGTTLITPKRPVVSKTSFGHGNYSSGDGYVNTFDDCTVDGEYVELAVFPEKVYYDYEYFNPDFTEITTTTGVPYYELNPPKHTVRPRYTPSSSHYTLGLIYQKKLYIKEIRSSSSQRVEFDYKYLDNDEAILKKLSLYQSGRNIKEYVLDSDIVATDFAFSTFSDPYNLIEALVAQNVDLNSDDNNFVHKLRDYDVSFGNSLLQKYIEPGYQSNMYQRLFLNGIVLHEEGDSRRILSFEYDQPSKLPRKNSLVRKRKGYMIHPTYLEFANTNRITTNNEKDIIVTSPFVALQQPTLPTIGILKRVNMESGGYLKFDFINNPNRMRSIAYHADPSATPVSIYLDFITRGFNEETKEFGSSSSSQYSTISPRYSYSHIFEFPKSEDNDKYKLKLITSNTEYINDIDWFNNGLTNFKECWIDYNGNGSEVYKFYTPEQVGHSTYDNFVDFVDQVTFRGDYDPDTGFNIVETLTKKEDYDHFPFSNIKSLHYAAGILKEHFVLNSDGDVLKRSKYNYNFSSELNSVSTSYGMKAGKIDNGYWWGHCRDDWNPVKWIDELKLEDQDYRAGRYTHKSIHYYLESTQTFEYDPKSSTELVSETVNEIGANHLMKRQQSVTAKNSTHTTHTLTLYPDDYTTTTGFIGALKTQNIKNAPIEVVNYQINNEGEKEILSGEIYEYDPDNPTQLANHYHLELSEPLPLSSFKFSNASSGTIPVADHKGAYSKYSGYELTKRERKYDDFGRVFASKSIEDVWQGKLFHKTFNQPVASVVNQEIQRKDASGSESKSKSVPGSEVEDYLSIDININKKQTVNITTSMVKTSGSDTDDFQYYIYIIGPANQINQAFNSNDIDYDVELEPGSYEVQYYSRNISSNNNQYRKDMEVSFVNEVYDAYFTSFEEDGTLSENARCGENYKESGIIEIPYAVDNPEEYTISYWYYENDEWKYSGKLPFQQSISVSNPTDDLRMHKKGARMSSMVYDEEGKLICEIDENENKSCYEYDAFDRLIIEKDHKDNIVRRLEYNLVGTN